jgi:hypothetical protein
VAVYKKQYIYIARVEMLSAEKGVKYLGDACAQRFGERARVRR